MQVVEVVHHGILVPVREHVDDGIIVDVANDAARLDEVDFVNAHPLRCLEPELCFQLVDVVAEDVADGLLVKASVIGDAGEGSHQALLADPLHQPVGHFALGVDGGQLIHESLAARLAPPAARVHVDRKALAVGWLVADDLLIAPVADQAIRTAGRADAGRVRDFGIYVIVVVGFLDPLHLEIGELQDVRGHGSVAGSQRDIH